MQNISSENSLPLPRNRKKSEMISLTCGVNDHVYTESKSIELRTDLDNIEVKRILLLS